MSRLALRHDVAKYLTRAARNLEDEPISTVLADMLIRDLYQSPTGGRPSRRFDELAAAVGERARAAITARFRELDALEVSIRGRDQVAMRRGAALALEIGRLLDDATSEQP